MINYSIIAAVSDNGVIGLNNKMPWHMPEDLKLFKRLTTGNIIIMGRKTFDSIGRPLPGRTTVVVTRTPEDFTAKNRFDNLFAYKTLEEALSESAVKAENNPAEAEIFVAGGASIYAQAIDGADKLFISRIPGEFKGDTFFPEITENRWRLDCCEELDGFRLEKYLQR